MKIRVYYEDTDCGNVVYYANYLRYMERSRTEFFRERGVELTDYHKRGFHFVVVEAHCRYRAPARYNDLLEVQSRLGEVTSASIEFLTDISNGQNELLVTGKVRIACVSDKGSACRIPEDLLNALTEKR